MNLRELNFKQKDEKYKETNCLFKKVLILQEKRHPLSAPLYLKEEQTSNPDKIGEILEVHFIPGMTGSYDCTVCLNSGRKERCNILQLAYMLE